MPAEGDLWADSWLSSTVSSDILCRVTWVDEDNQPINGLPPSNKPVFIHQGGVPASPQVGDLLGEDVLRPEMVRLEDGWHRFEQAEFFQTYEPGDFFEVNIKLTGVDPRTYNLLTGAVWGEHLQLIQMDDDTWRCTDCGSESMDPGIIGEMPCD